MDDVTSTGRRVPALIRPVRNWVRAFPKLAIVGAVTLFALLYDEDMGEHHVLPAGRGVAPHFADAVLEPRASITQRGSSWRS